MSTKVELLRRLRSEGDVTVIDELRTRNYLSAESNRTYGVEIECIFPSAGAVREFIDAINTNTNLTIRDAGYTHTTTPHWKIVTDGSLRTTTSGVGREIVSPILKGADGKRQLKIICEYLKAFDVKVNKTCGMHVHFGVKDFKLADFKKLVSIYAYHEGDIDEMVAKSRRGDTNTYCGSIRRLSQHTIQNASSVRALDSAIGGRYHKLNLAAYVRHGTVEFRQHQGTTEFEKISQWIDFGLSMMRWAKYSKVPYTADLTTGCELSAEAIGYWVRRAQKLSA